LNNPVLVLRAKTEPLEGVAAETIKPALSLSKGWRKQSIPAATGERLNKL
jgi:hypothetical protein